VTAVWLPWAASGGLPGWARALPVLVAVSLIAVVANVSAVRRLRHLARGAASDDAKVARLPAHPLEKGSGGDLARNGAGGELARESSA
jgi:hypothetical protein